MTARETKVTLQVLWQSEDSIRVTPFKEGTALESTVKTSRVCPFHSAMVAERAREILGILARANAGAENLLGELVDAGRAIYVDLLPAFLKEKLREARGHSLVLHLDRPLLGIPWELLHDGDDFLGRHHRIGRLVTLEQEGPPVLQRRMRPPLAVLVVADPSGDLPAARTEAEEVERILHAVPAVATVTTLVGDVTTRAFRDELARHDVLHFAGHADFVDRRGEAHLRLADGPFSTRLIDQLRGQIDFPGLVFLNACGSAEDTRRLSSRADPLGAGAGVASALLLAGVRHVVGTLWEVRDEVARVFARQFYRTVFGGDTIGAAMAAGREAVSSAYGEERLLWADHLLYGDPTFRVDTVQPSNLVFDDLDVLDGLERKHRQELFSEDAPTRLLAAAMLLRLGDRTVVSAVRRDVDLLGRWMSPHATRQESRQAAFVVQALAAAAGLSPSEAPERLPDLPAVEALIERLGRG